MIITKSLIYSDQIIVTSVMLRGQARKVGIFWIIFAVLVSFAGNNFALAQGIDGILTKEEAQANNEFADRFSSLERFGHSVAIDDAHILIGADRKDNAVIDAGTAYLYDLKSGDLIHRFFNPAPASHDWFGYSVAMGNGYAFVGAWGVDREGPDVGAVFQFDVNSGNLVRIIENPTPQGGDQFGRALALSNNRLLVGALSDNTAGPDAGAAYLLDVNSAELMMTFLNPSPGRGDWFGYSVAIYENMLVIGAEKDDDIVDNGGAAYLFDGSTGELLRSFSPANPHVEDQFGHSLAIDAERIAIGADQDHIAASRGGAVYLYDSYLSDSSTLFLPPNPAEGDRFGHWIAIMEPYLIIGADLQDTSESNAGVVYQYTLDSGELIRTILNPELSEGGNFGHSLSVNGESIIVGSAHSDVAYLFDLRNGEQQNSFLDPDPRSPSPGFPILIVAIGATIVVVIISIGLVQRRRSHRIENNS